jgi:hypothetical protein
VAIPVFRGSLENFHGRCLLYAVDDLGFAEVTAFGAFVTTEFYWFRYCSGGKPMIFLNHSSQKAGFPSSSIFKVPTPKIKPKTMTHDPNRLFRAAASVVAFPLFLHSAGANRSVPKNHFLSITGKQFRQSDMMKSVGIFKHVRVCLGAFSLVVASVMGSWPGLAMAQNPAATPQSLVTIDTHAARVRQTISLDGTWQIAEGKMEPIPAVFDRIVPVPGLVDLAKPSFAEVGPPVADCNQPRQKDPRRDAFWYRRTFTLAGPLSAVATLKIGKAMFGTRVYLNGKLLGDHLPCFTPGYFDTRPALIEGENELIVRIGADRDALPVSIVNGFDYEKRRYIPGIFDSVELILSGTPNIVNLQVAPQLAAKQAKVRVWIKGTAGGDLAVEIREAKSGTPVGTVQAKLNTDAEQAVDLLIPVDGCHPWSPEDPFLYEVTARTAGDEFKTRFGMREFNFDPATKRAMLNGKPYFLRGSNITLYRFFEDPDRGTLPCDEKWIRTVHQRAKEMHWNSFRYCIGFPPEKWYKIADEEGILIQDEFPIWATASHWPIYLPGVKRDGLAVEYAEWMRERWNHPCVVIWDASNETYSLETGPAVAQVRGLDLSYRPWDNSYSQQRDVGDVCEQHAYHWTPDYKFKNLAKADLVPQTWGAPFNDQKYSVILNEYGWLWLNRDGSPTRLTVELYKNLAPNSTAAARFRIQASYMAAETEFWRAHRQVAGVLHFTMLGYSRPDGQTSDHWADVKTLTWEPEFRDWMLDAFAPVGLMVNCFEPAGTTVPIILINDLEKSWQGPVALSIRHNGKLLSEQTRDGKIDGFGTATLEFPVVWPAGVGEIQVEARIAGADGKPVRSRRIFTIKPMARSLSFQRPVTASSVYEEYAAANAVDGNDTTYWSSTFADPAWLAVDLGEAKTVSRIAIIWEPAYAKAFSVQISADGQTWTEVYKTADGQGGTSEIKFAPATARHVRITGTQRATGWGYGICELQVFEK